MKVLIVEGPETKLNVIMARFRTYGVKFTLMEEAFITELPSAIPPSTGGGEDDEDAGDDLADDGVSNLEEEDTNTAGNNTQTGDSDTNLDNKVGETGNNQEGSAVLEEPAAAPVPQPTQPKQGKQGGKKNTGKKTQ